MDFHRPQLRCPERVKERDARVRVCARVDNKPVRVCKIGFLYPVHQIAFMIGLLLNHFDSAFRAVRCNPLGQMRKTLKAVLIRLANPEQIQVRSVQNIQFHPFFLLLSMISAASSGVRKPATRRSTVAR